MRNKFISLTLICFLFQACNPLDSDPGTGVISVMIDGKKYEASDVKGTEYFGFYCSGKILNKTIGLGLGIAPYTGDTLSFLNKQMASSYDIFVSYGGNYGIKRVGKLLSPKNLAQKSRVNFFVKFLLIKTQSILVTGTLRLSAQPQDSKY